MDQTAQATISVVFVLTISLFLVSSIVTYAAPISPANCTELRTLIEANCSADYELQVDIDCTGETNLTPICTGTYGGNFDGENHTITGLMINVTGISNMGLFSRLQSPGTIKNIGIIDVNLTSTWIMAGALVGYAGGYIDNSYSTGTVTAERHAGGLVGWLVGVINNSNSSCDVYANVESAGGLVGSSSRGEVFNSYATGNVESAGARAGGLIGYASWGSFVGSGWTVNNSYATGNVSGDREVGGLVGYQRYSWVDNSYATGDVLGSALVGGLIGYNYYSGVDNSYATGNVVGTSWGMGGLVGNNYYSPIDNSYATGNVSGDYAGGLVGNVYYSNINNCYATGNVLGTYGNGGLVGYIWWYSSIDNSYATGEITGDEAVGGLVGYIFDYSAIDNSYATGNVNGTNNVGGLIGYVYWYSDIDNSYATGDVVGNNRVGGLVGRLQDSALSDSFSTGNVDATTEVGGLVGSTNDANSITNCGWIIGSASSAIGDPSENLTYNETDPTVFYDVVDTHAIYSTWNFTNIWCDIYDDIDYPILKWQSECTPISNPTPQPSGGNGCSKDWECNAWSICINGTQIRTCNCDCANDNDCDGDSSTTRNCECTSNSDCDDGNDCTQGICLNFECEYNDLTGTDCDDGDNCTDDDRCRSGVCFGNVDSDCYEDEDKVDDSGGFDDKECLQEWACGQWTECAKGIQSRTCVCECDDNDCYGNSTTSQECDMEEYKEETELDVGSIEEETEGLSTESDQNGLSASPLDNPTNWLLIIILLAALIFLIAWKKKKQKKEEDL